MIKEALIICIIFTARLGNNIPPHCQKMTEPQPALIRHDPEYRNHLKTLWRRIITGTRLRARRLERHELRQVIRGYTNLLEHYNTPASLALLTDLDTHVFEAGQMIRAFNNLATQIVLREQD